MIHAHRMTALMEEPFVVFLIGMRVNAWWKFHQWMRIGMAMPQMLKELAAHPELGYLGGESWGGRTTIMVQYWRSFEALEDYARNKTHAHLPAWKAFNQRIGNQPDVGIWHETYLIQPDQYECVYHHMPPFGLGRVGKLVEASNRLAGARGRLQS